MNERELLAKAEQGNIESQFELGMLYKEAGELNKAGHWLNTAANNSSSGENSKATRAKARSSLGLMYANAGNMEQAKLFMEAAAMDGEVPAIRNLMFLNSMNGLPGDNREGFLKWTKELAYKHDEYTAMVLLGAVYFGCPKNDVISKLSIGPEHYNVEEGYRLIEKGIELAEKEGDKSRLIFTDYFEAALAYQSDTRKSYMGGKSFLYEKLGLKAWERKLYFAEKALELAKQDKNGAQFLEAYTGFRDAAKKELEDLRAVKKSEDAIRG